MGDKAMPMKSILEMTAKDLMSAGAALDEQAGDEPGTALKKLAEKIRQARGPARQTVWRNQASAGVQFAPAIARTSKSRQEDSGRLYGELAAGSPAQRQADAGIWEVGKRVRDQRNPFAVSVDGTVVRVYEVKDWVPSSESRKWIAVLGNLLTNDDLDEIAGYPLRIGDALPTRQGKAYRPVPFV